MQMTLNQAIRKHNVKNIELVKMERIGPHSILLIHKVHYHDIWSRVSTFDRKSLLGKFFAVSCLR